MTGRDMVNFILSNGLQDVEIFCKGKLIGYIDEDEAALKFGVGSSTIRVWVNQEKLKGINVNGVVYIPYNATDPRKTKEKENE